MCSIIYTDARHGNFAFFSAAKCSVEEKTFETTKARVT